MQISKTNYGNVAVLKIEGPVIEDKIESLRETIVDVVSRGRRKVLLDLQNVPFWDSAALEWLQEFVRTMSFDGTELAVCALNEVGNDIFKVTLMDTFVLVYETQEEGLKGMAK